MIEPNPPSSWVAGTETVLRHAEQRPDVVLTLLAILGPLALIIGFVWVVVRYVIPAWREEKQADRVALASEFGKLREDTRDVIKAERDLAASQHAALVDRLESSGADLAKLSDRVERQGHQLTTIAAKLGVTIGIFVLGCLAYMLFGGGTVSKTNKRPPVTASGCIECLPNVAQCTVPNCRAETQVRNLCDQRQCTAEGCTCNPACKEGTHCCAKGSGCGCCKDKATADGSVSEEMGPHSASKFADRSNYVANICDRMTTLCEP